MSHKYSHFPYTDLPYIDDFCDDEVYVFSTIGQGPAGEVGNPGPQGEKGDPGKDGILSFDTVADMQASTDLEVGMTVHTNGFHEIGDGGAAYYSISNDSTTNEMDVLELQNSLYATLVVTEPYVTLEQLGARGDGSHDDTSFLEYALKNYTHIRGNGEYLVGAVIAASEINKDTILEDCNLIAKSGEYTLTIITARETYSHTNLQLRGIHAICENGYFLSLSGTAAQATGQFPIVIENCSVRAGNNENPQVLIKDLSNVQANGITIKGYSTNRSVGTGIELTGGINNNYNNIYVDHLGLGIHLHSHDAVNTEGFNFTNVVVLNCDNDLYCESVGSTSLLQHTFTNCIFDITALSVRLRNVQGIKFIGCYFGVYSTYETDVCHFSMQTSCRSVVIDDCLFIGNNVNTISFNMLSNLSTRGRTVAMISNCTFTNVYRVFGGAGYFQEAVFMNLMFENSTPYQVAGSSIFIGCRSDTALVIQNVPLIGCVNITNS